MRLSLRCGHVALREKKGPLLLMESEFALPRPDTHTQRNVRGILLFVAKFRLKPYRLPAVFEMHRHVHVVEGGTVEHDKRMQSKRPSANASPKPPCRPILPPPKHLACTPKSEGMYGINCNQA